jgi:hypothetical protein
MFSKREYKNLIVDGMGDASVILLEDMIPFENVETVLIHEYRVLTKEAADFVDKNFEEVKKKNPITYNGTIYGVVDIRVDNRRVYLNFEESEFKYNLATLSADYIPYIKDGNYFVLAIGVCGIVETSDNKIFFVHPLPTNRYKTLGGFCDGSDLIGSTLDLKNTFFREASEELGELKLYNEKILCMGKVGDSMPVLCYAKTDCSSKEVIQIREENKGKLPDLYETDNMVFVDNTPAEIGKFLLNNQNDMTHATRFNIKYYVKSKFSNYDFMSIR